jgi:hypothetical protein
MNREAVVIWQASGPCNLHLPSTSAGHRQLPVLSFFVINFNIQPFDWQPRFPIPDVVSRSLQRIARPTTRKSG